MKYTLTVKGMHCKSCKMLLTEVLGELGVTNLHFDLDEKKQVGILTCDYPGDPKEIKESIQASGDYQVE